MWWFQIFLIFIPTWGNDPIWRSYFSNGLVQPPTSNGFALGNWSKVANATPLIAMLDNSTARWYGLQHHLSNSWGMDEDTKKGRTRKDENLPVWRGLIILNNTPCMVLFRFGHLEMEMMFNFFFTSIRWLHPWRLAWNIIIFLSQWVICRFHVNLPGCKDGEGTIGSMSAGHKSKYLKTRGELALCHEEIVTLFFSWS